MDGIHDLGGKQGFGPVRVLAELTANDLDSEYRQIAVIDREGRTSAYTGPKTRGAASATSRDRHVLTRVLTEISQII